MASSVLVVSNDSQIGWIAAIVKLVVTVEAEESAFGLWSCSCVFLLANRSDTTRISPLEYENMNFLLRDTRR